MDRARIELEDDEARRAAHLKQQQLQVLCRQATRAPYAVIVAIGFVAAAVWEYAPASTVVAWAAVLLLFPLVRGIYSARALRHPPADAAPGLGFHVVSTFTGGIVVGLAAPLFFEPLSDERRAFLTMILICWAAAAVSVLAAYARTYYAYVAPIVVQLAAAWALVGSATIDAGERMIAAALILCAGVILSFFVRDSERVLKSSFRIRYENEQLIAALERERQEVAIARDKAEAANRAKSRFLAAASHDLRQPMQALSLFSGALADRVREGELDNIPRKIAQCLASLSALTETLVDISKLDAGTTKPRLDRVSVREVLERVEAHLAPLARERGLALKVRCAEAEIETDPALLERILRNLVDNGIKYTAKGEVILAAEREGAAVRFSVRDTGAGIAPEECERIFEEYYQIDNPERDRAQGLGLGLAIVRGLARLLGTEVLLTSELGKGSEFSLRLPLAPPERPAEAERPAPDVLDAGPELAGAKILVIDDEPDVLSGMRQLLEGCGCRVTVAGGRAEAEKLLERHGLAFDIIVADFRLRGREDGIDTVHRLRRRIGETVPAILVSGDTAPERLREAHESGLPLLHKPVTPEKLKEALAEVLRG